jgi:hypothetical protein
MPFGEEAYTNLRIRNSIHVKNLTISGNLDIDLTKLHVQSHGNFASSLSTGGLDYMLYINPTGRYVQLYSFDAENVQSVIESLYVDDETRILFSDMHYDHLLNDSYSYKFMSDRSTVLLTYVDTNITKSVVLNKQ